MPLNDQIISRLEACQTNMADVRSRFFGDDELYMSCLRIFVKDKTIDALNKALKSASWADAYNSAHALKGLAGNMGFVPLYNAVDSLMLLLKNGKYIEIELAILNVRYAYVEVVSAILISL